MRKKTRHKRKPANVGSFQTATQHGQSTPGIVREVTVEYVPLDPRIRERVRQALIARGFDQNPVDLGRDTSIVCLH
jgi:hypothetical protein